MSERQVSGVDGRAVVDTMIPVGKRVAYTVNQIGVNMLWQAFNTVAVYFYVTELHVSAVDISTGMIVYGIVNAFFNLLAGHISDRTKTRWGRRIPYIAVCSLPFALSFYFLFSPPSMGHTGQLIYFFVLTFFFDLFFTFTALNTGALYPEMYPNHRDRANISALQQIFGIVGMVIGVALSKALGQSLGWHTMGAVFGAIAALSLYISLYGSFENPAYRESSFRFRDALAATFQNRAFLLYVGGSFLVQFTTTLFTTVSAFYTQYVVPVGALQSSLFLGGIFIVAMPVSLVWAKAAIRFSAIRMILISIFLYALFSLAFLFDHTAASLLATGFLLGVPVAGFLVLLNVLLGEVIDDDASRTNRRREGMYLGMNGFIVRLGLSLQYAVLSIFFHMSGYNSNATKQTGGAIVGLRILSGGVPILFLAIAFVLLALYARQVRRRRLDAMSQ